MRTPECKIECNLTLCFLSESSGQKNTARLIDGVTTMSASTAKRKVSVTAERKKLLGVKSHERRPFDIVFLCG